MTQLLDYALAYASNNWQVFPLKTKDKIPAVKWADVATTDANMICGWWEHEPNANIGIVTGSKSGLFVLDIDAGHGGIESLTTLIKVYGELPKTPVAITGGGGRHIFFKYHPGTKNTAGKIGAGIDTRSEGGYVVGSGSVHPNGNLYTWDERYTPENTPIADAPGWLLKLAMAETVTPAQPSQIVDGNSAIINGGRNNTLTTLAGAMRRRGMGEDAIYQALLSENKTKCIPPLTDNEVKQIAHSVARYSHEVEFEQRDRARAEWGFAKAVYDFPNNGADFISLPAECFSNHSLRDWWAGILRGEDMGDLTVKFGILADLENFKDYDPFKIDAYARAIIRFGHLAKVARYADTLKMAANKGDDPAIDKTINEINKNITSTGRSVEVLSDIAEQVDLEIRARALNPTKVWGIPYAYPRLSELTGGKQKGELILHSAEPKIGKSWWWLQDALETSIKETPVFYWCGEMKRTQLMRRFYQLLGVNGRNMKEGNMTEQDWDNLSDAKALILNSPLFIDDKPLLLHELRPLLARQKQEHGIEQFIIDYASKILAPGMNEIEQSQNISKEVKNICNDLDLSGVLITSVNKMGMDGKGENVTKGNVRGSGQQIHDADIIYIMTKFNGATYGQDYGIMPNDYDSVISLHIAAGRELDQQIEGGFIPYRRIGNTPKFEELRKVK